MALNKSSLLIRDYENIRQILRDIYIFGCFSRDDFIEKKGISGRKYDKEQQRISSYLPEGFIQKRRVDKKVQLYCSYNIMDGGSNHLAETYRNKSFTALDIMSFFFVQQLLNENEEMTAAEILDALPANNDSVEALFSIDEGEELLFTGTEGLIGPVMEGDFPVRSSILENQAAKSLVQSPYAGNFLRKDTMEKLKKATDMVPEDWNPDDITVKNVFDNGIRSSGRLFDQEISVIAKAIYEKCAIRYDNVRPGRVEKKGALAFPVRIEYSVVNDRFRINAYEPVEMRFIKMNLDTMVNIEVSDEVTDVDLETEYAEFIKLNTKKVVLDVEPVDHIIERCFRVFSYYDRKARYDKEEHVYRLEISYLKADENEVIKNILSMGSHVVVMEPRTIQKEVYRRILAASKLYS